MQWLQQSNQSKTDNLNNVGREASTHFRNKKKKYLKAKKINLKLTVTSEYQRLV
jgi:hypothetical protein